MSIEVRGGGVHEAFWCAAVSLLRSLEHSFPMLTIVINVRYFGESIRDDYANGQLDVQVETILGEMKELAIYGV